MAELHSYLAGLRAELESAKKLGRDTIADIESEIGRVDAHLRKRAAAVTPASHAASQPTASAAEKSRAYLAGLKEELANAEKLGLDNAAEVRAEIARVEEEMAKAERGDDSSSVRTATDQRAAAAQRAVAPPVRK